MGSRDDRFTRRQAEIQRRKQLAKLSGAPPEEITGRPLRPKPRRPAPARRVVVREFREIGFIEFSWGEVRPAPPPPNPNELHYNEDLPTE